MTDIKGVLRRWSARQSLHRIARESGVDRKTVRRYVMAQRRGDQWKIRMLLIRGVADRTNFRGSFDVAETSVR
jgi:predicted transcriptional regulator